LYRQSVEEFVRPRLIDLMSTENWWRRFYEVSDL